MGETPRIISPVNYTSGVGHKKNVHKNQGILNFRLKSYNNRYKFLDYEFSKAPYLVLSLPSISASLITVIYQTVSDKNIIHTEQKFSCSVLQT